MGRDQSSRGILLGAGEVKNNADKVPEEASLFTFSKTEKNTLCSMH